MKGEARPSWTTGRHKWLRTLADGARRKPKGTSEGSVATYCRALGWTSINPPLGHVLTAEGIATLARWDAGDHGVVPRPKPKGFVVTGLSPVQLATKLLEQGEGPALAVYEALHTGLFGEMPPARKPQRFVPGGGQPGLRPGEVAAILSEGVASGEIGADPGLEVGGTTHGKLYQRACPVKIEAPPPVMREDAPTECTATAPPDCAAVPEPRHAPFGMAPSLGMRVTPPGFSPCLACGGKGKGRYNWPCQPCNGSGRIRRTVEP